MANDQYILDHYKSVAKNFGSSGLSSIQDKAIRDSEINFFTGELLRTKSDELRVLDLGCGNAFLLEKIRECLPKAKLFGLEFSPELFELAQQRNIEDCEFQLGDMRKEYFSGLEFDFIITERSLINLLSWKQQKKAIQNIFKHLRHGGNYLLSESFRTPLISLNKARAEFGLEALEQSKHNLYLQDSFDGELEKLGLVKKPTTFVENYLSTHFYLSRVMHIVLREKGSRMKGSHFVDFFNLSLEPGIGNYSPILFKLFKKS